MPLQQQLVIVVLAIIAVGVGAFSLATGRMFSNQSKTTTVAEIVTPYPTISEAYVAPTSAPKEINIAGAAFIAKEQMCTYSAKNIVLKMYTKSNNVRVDAATSGENARKAHIIITDSQSYVWDMDKKEGMMIKDDPTGLLSPDGILDLISHQLGITPEQFEETCKIQKVADTQFVAPKDVSFIPLGDLGALGSLLPQLGSLSGLFN